jgi:hypothetical protein
MTFDPNLRIFATTVFQNQNGNPIKKARSSAMKLFVKIKKLSCREAIAIFNVPEAFPLFSIRLS